MSDSCMTCGGIRRVTVEKADKGTGEKFWTPIDCPACSRRMPDVQPEQQPFALGMAVMVDMGAGLDGNPITGEGKIIGIVNDGEAFRVSFGKNADGSENVADFTGFRVKPLNRLHPWLKEILYQRCLLCKGTLKIVGQGSLEGRDCPECTAEGCEHPGYIEVGITVGQFERIVGERDWLVKQFVGMESNHDMTFTEMSEKIAHALSKINKSSLSVARFDRDREERRNAKPG